MIRRELRRSVDFSKLYHRPNSVNGTNAAKPVQSDAPRRAPAGGPLAEGVELAYSVIEKYIAEGRRTAEGFSSQPYTTRAATDNLQDILERILRFQAEILPLCDRDAGHIGEESIRAKRLCSSAAMCGRAPNGAQN